MCAENNASPGKQSPLTARRGQGGRFISREQSRQSQGHNPVAGLGTHPFCVVRGVPLRVNPTPKPTPTAPATIPTVPQTPRCPPAAVTPDGTPGSVSLPEATSKSSVACCGGSGPELSPLRTLVICPAFTSTQTPARLQTLTNPSKVITFIVPVVLSNATKKSVPTTPATPAGVRTSNFPSGLAIFCAFVRSFPYVSSSSVCCAPASCLTTFMDDSEPTFSTEPSSSAMRARAFTWVFTRSCQSTAVFADAVMVFPPRAMFTAGITRETSPARSPAAWGAAQTSAGMEIRNESSKASPKACGDFVFIEDSPGSTACIYRTYWRAPVLSTAKLKLGDGQEPNSAAAIQDENEGRCFLTHHAVRCA